MSKNKKPEDVLYWNYDKATQDRLLELGLWRVDVRINKNVYNDLVKVADDMGLSVPETAYFLIKWYIENKEELSTIGVMETDE